ncbi:TnpV protein [uncultured Cloacibacillus sp.]|uniref:TnpV protein n=1 Tax=uncultured Cloacibacillus sp. TaxID=889794 RepID=UPI0026DC7522|nr:TnpV protein [uncultured Cloacibacillus sp.]
MDKSFEEIMEGMKTGAPEEEKTDAEMPEYIVENGITYRREGDFYVPDLRAEEAIPERIGRYGRARLKFLRDNRPEEENRMILDGNINEILEQLNEEAENRIRELTTELERKNPAPDKMKHQLEWVAHMNMLKEQAIEIVMNEMIYV